MKSSKPDTTKRRITNRGLETAKRFKDTLLSKVHPSGLLGLVLIIAAGTAWSDDAPTTKEIRVFIERQVLSAFENDEEIYSFDIVTGRDGKETTAGRYQIFRKHEKYTSKSYGSEMPYTMFFTEDGKAIHGTQMATLRSYLHSYLN
jgi:hypothetical protein